MAKDKKEKGFFARIDRDTVNHYAYAGMAIGVIAGGITGGIFTALPIPLGIFLGACAGMSIGAMLGLFIGYLAEIYRVSYECCTEKPSFSL